MFVRVEIEFGRHDAATVIPQNALVKRDSQQGVFLVDSQEMKVRFVPVTLGIVNANVVEVVRPSLSGVVVTLGNHLLEDGSAVILPSSK
jgi:multidrug efflux pump subunit AcrA (membrane-fusion protein)